MQTQAKFLSSVAVLSALVCSACIVPYKTRPMTQTFSGAEVAPSILQPGVSRSQLRESLGSAVVAEGPHLIWARLRFSSSATFVGFGGIGNSPGAAGGWISDERNWHTQNFFLTLDDRGSVISQEIVTDAQLDPVLRRLLHLNSLAVANFEAPVAISALRHHHFYDKPATLTLYENEVVLVTHDRTRHIAPSALVDLVHRHTCPVTGTNETLCESLVISEDQRHITFSLRMKAADVLTVLAYIDRFGMQR